MRRIRQTLLLTAAVACSVNASGAVESLENLTKLWRTKKYTQVLPLLFAYRNQPGGRTWPVDYMIGTSECRVPGREEKGASILAYVLDNYRLPDTARSMTEQELRHCPQNRDPTDEEPSFLVPLTGQVANGPLVAGKGGYMVGTSTNVTTAKAQVTPVSVADLQKRVYKLDQAQAAAKAAQDRLTGSGASAVKNGFVVVCIGQCEFPPEMTAECLVKYRPPLEKQFQIVIPEALITVYVARHPEDVTAAAGRLHGVQLPLGTLAYSVYEDLSMVGIADAESCGSLAHELVHLGIRQNFGDSPAWLEEGLASEIAISGPSLARFRFGESWRDDMLRKKWSMRPTVAQLLKTRWTNFASTDAASLERVAALHAMDAVFIRYLDARGKLLPIYVAVRDGRFSDSTVPRTDATIVEEQLGMTLEQADADFVKWFRHLP